MSVSLPADGFPSPPRLSRVSWRRGWELVDRARRLTQAGMRWLLRRTRSLVTWLRLRRTAPLLLAAAFGAVGCTPQMLPASTPTLTRQQLMLYTTSSAAPLLTDLVQAYQRIAPETEIQIVTTSYAAFAASPMPGYLLTHHPPEEAAAAWAAPIAQDGLIALTNAANPVTGLTTDDLRLIFQGWLDNWAALGGADAPITVLSREDGSGVRTEFEALVLGSRRLVSSAQIAPSESAMRQLASRDPNAVGYGSLGALNASGDSAVRALTMNGVAPTQAEVSAGAYPLRSFIYLVGAAEPEGPLRRFIAWAQSADGQAVAARHYAPVNGQ